MNKHKHLEFIQNTITRMNNNSFLIKAWTIAILSGIFVFSSKNSKTVLYFFILAPLISLWILDSLYLRYERKYRALYNEVSKKKEKHIDFSMDISKFKSSKYNLSSCMFSETQRSFYGILFVLLSSGFIIESKYY
ncbi:DUF3278 domain-containing protein [Leptospira mayottensis]|uniref:DUF3278 domain-containing protein n=1 Tax=Leptospira mayottensis TaxID=1137606 RepID=A0ABN5NXQ1_9LEPT|nr:DUF3278 domain-containing protein [Leptospira mayottensis]AXR62584.1 hypothetical protein DQM68_17940 [Leptospira mayottensis]AXR62822.1 hypothetical protein DQM68_19430 [Leptospira mayottensis]AXR66281.1 hypothetical protein DQM28_18790 [Leptospira mayottensis]AXR66523.1 hypothetical protein DQM28_20280 [Leptospira mayottensis]TGN17769.1 DUF3278 domain-containing protein [Leptospira mayottensis]